jgi:hypothetical protein
MKKSQEAGTAVLAIHPAGRNTRSIAEFQQAIETCYQKNAGTALELAMLCKDAKAEVMDDELAALVKSLKTISGSNFSKLVVIGNDSRLYEPGMQERLPGAWSLIYAIACIKRGAEWDAALAANVIHPGATRRDINAWKREFRNEPEPVKKVKTAAATVASALKKDRAGFMAALGEIGIVPVQAVAPVASAAGAKASHAPAASTGGSIVKATANDVATAEA